VQRLNNLLKQISASFLARDAFVRTNRRATAVMFVRLSVWDDRALWSSQRSFQFTSNVLGTWHQSVSTYSRPSFNGSTWKRGGCGCAN